jgi:activating signal cointegrator complex subunit 3
MPDLCIGFVVDWQALLHVLCGAAEYDELPVRHNEEKLNEGLAKQVRWAVDTRSLDDPHVKTNLLLQAHFTRMELPISDYVTDTKSVLDQSIRVLQAMVDVAANGGWLQTALSTMHLLQMIMQGLWWDEGEHLGLKMLPHVEGSTLTNLRHQGISNLHLLLSLTADRIRGILKSIFVPSQVADFMQVCLKTSTPQLVSLYACWFDSSWNFDSGSS